MSTLYLLVLLSSLVATQVAAQADVERFYWLRLENDYVLGRIVHDMQEGDIFVTCDNEKQNVDVEDLQEADVQCPEHVGPFFAMSQILEIDEQGTVVVRQQGGATLMLDAASLQAVGVSPESLNVGDQVWVVQGEEGVLVDLYARADDTGEMRIQ